MTGTRYPPFIPVLCLRLTSHIVYIRVLIIYIIYLFDCNKCLCSKLVMIRTPNATSYLYLSYPRVPVLPKVEGTPSTSSLKVPSYPWVPMVTTHGFLTSQVTTRWVLVRTSDFPEVPLPAGKNPCLSLHEEGDQTKPVYAIDVDQNDSDADPEMSEMEE